MLLLIVEKIVDNGYDPIDYNEKRYIDGSNAQTEFYYDKNGNLIADFDRKICSIQYNVLSLPDQFNFDIKQSYNPLIWLRNIETRIGKKVAGEGQAYQIQIYGSQALMPLFPWVK